MHDSRWDRIAAAIFAPTSSGKSRMCMSILVCLLSAGAARAGDGMANGRLVLHPGAAAFAHTQDAESFGNAAIEASWSIDQQHLIDMVVTDRVHHRTLKVTAPFALVLADGSTIRAADMRLLSPPREQALLVDANSSRLAARLQGKSVQASFGDVADRFRVDWKLVQRDGSHYLREEVSISALKQNEKIAKVSLLETTVAACS